MFNDHELGVRPEILNKSDVRKYFLLSIIHFALIDKVVKFFKWIKNVTQIYNLLI